MCYGRVVTDAGKLKPLNATVLGIFGAEDRGIPPDQVRQFEKALKGAGKKVERVQIYDKAGHGFMRAGEAPGANEANKKAHDEAWKRWKEQLGKL